MTDYATFLDSFNLLLFFPVLRIELQALCMLGEHSCHWTTSSTLLIMSDGLMKDTSAGVLVLVIGMYVSPKDENPIGDALAASGIFHMEWQTWEALLNMGLDSIVRHVGFRAHLPLFFFYSYQLLTGKVIGSENLAWSLYFLRFTSNNECGFQVTESFIDQVLSTLNIWYFSLYITC